MTAQGPAYSKRAKALAAAVISQPSLAPQAAQGWGQATPRPGSRWVNGSSNHYHYWITFLSVGPPC